MGGIWAFVIVWLIGMLWVGGDLLWALILFFVAAAMSFAMMGVSSGDSGRNVSVS